MAEFSNPNQQGGQDGQTLMTVMIVVVAIVLGLQFYRSKTAPPSSLTPPSPPSRHPPNRVTSGWPRRRGHTAKQLLPLSPQPLPSQTAQAAAESTTVVENDLYRIAFPTAAPR